jgi:D-tyrosyl-tRNA(Tyr) deacylase
MGRIGPGLLLLAAFTEQDTTRDLEWMARKVLNLRVFDDEAGVMNRSLTDVGGEVLAVSQFTLYGDVRKGNRPSYNRAAPAERAARLYEAFVGHLQSALGRPVPTGRFGAEMHVYLVNDGPVTLIVDTPS